MNNCNYILTLESNPFLIKVTLSELCGLGDREERREIVLISRSLNDAVRKEGMGDNLLKK